MSHLDKQHAVKQKKEESYNMQSYKSMGLSSKSINNLSKDTR